jgi:hypothetical protein
MWRPARWSEGRHAVPMRLTSTPNKRARADGAARASLCARMFASSSGTTCVTLRGVASGCQLRAAARADMPRAGQSGRRIRTGGEAQVVTRRRWWIAPPTPNETCVWGGFRHFNTPKNQQREKARRCSDSRRPRGWQGHAGRSGDDPGDGRRRGRVCGMSDLLCKKNSQLAGPGVASRRWAAVLAAGSPCSLLPLPAKRVAALRRQCPDDTDGGGIQRRAKQLP